jgi:hypothetical protein
MSFPLIVYLLPVTTLCQQQKAAGDFYIAQMDYLSKQGLAKSK